MRQGMWYGIVELLEKEWKLETFLKDKQDAYITEIERRELELKALKNVRYTSTVEIIECGIEPIEYIEFDGDTVETIRNDRNKGGKLYNALRTLWLKEYMKTIQEMD